MSGTLDPRHYQMLHEGSGISPDVIKARGYRTCTGLSELKTLGIDIQRTTDPHGLLIPLYCPDGRPASHYLVKNDTTVPLMVYRPDVAEITKEGKARKYIYPTAAHMHLDCHPRAQAAIDDPAVPLWIVEGTKKEDALISHAACALGLSGVWCWSGTNPKGGKGALPDWRDVALNRREVRVAFDSDVVEKVTVAEALDALTAYLTSKGARVFVAYLPSANGHKVGVDDYLLTHTLQDLEGLLQAPRKHTKTTNTSTIPLKYTANGKPKNLLCNLMAVLEQDPAWADVLHLNQLSGKVELHRCPPGLTETSWQIRPLEETDVSLITRWFQETYDIEASSTLVAEALVTVASQHPYHPVRDYLTQLRWDGTPRLDTWLIDHCHAEDTPYVRAVGANTLKAAVARAMDPGCQTDTILILQGPQGLNKSTALRTLAGEDWFGDDMPRDLGNKDAKGYLRGHWIIEFAELSQFGRSEVEEIKSFVSTRVDTYRPAYGRQERSHPRQCLFVATTNSQEPFKDVSGNRRFWPVTVHGPCNLETLARDRNQLWAEAVARYHQGEAWYLTGGLLHCAEQEQADRVEEDAWTTPLLTYLATTMLQGVSYQGRTHSFITVAELLEQALQLDKLHWTPGNARRVANILRLHGWRNVRVENPDNEVGQPRQLRGYIRESDTSSEPHEPHDGGGQEASGSSASPHETSSEPYEPHEPDTFYTVGESYTPDNNKALSYSLNGKGSGSGGSSGSTTVTTDKQKTSPEPHAAPLSGSTCGSVCGSRPVVPPARCPTCNRPTTWRIRKEGLACYKCETVVPHFATYEEN